MSKWKLHMHMCTILTFLQKMSYHVYITFMALFSCHEDHHSVPGRKGAKPVNGVLGVFNIGWHVKHLGITDLLRETPLDHLKETTRYRDSSWFRGICRKHWYQYTGSVRIDIFKHQYSGETPSVRQRTNRTHSLRHVKSELWVIYESQAVSWM